MAYTLVVRILQALVEEDEVLVQLDFRWHVEGKEMSCSGLSSVRNSRTLLKLKFRPQILLCAHSIPRNVGEPREFEEEHWRGGVFR